VQFQDSDTNEFELAFDNWSDPEYLEGFFEEHRKDLESGFYGDMSVEEAIEITIKEAGQLEDRMRLIALGKDRGLSLKTLFRPLHNQDYRQSSHQKSKASGGQRKSWLRIYAIKVGDFYVICGSAIKLTLDMKDSNHLQKQLGKLEMTKNYLIENGVLDGNDFEFLEF
jgi:hypothetical protein